MLDKVILPNLGVKKLASIGRRDIATSSRSTLP
jgi:hypothetical protein